MVFYRIIWPPSSYFRFIGISSSFCNFGSAFSSRYWVADWSWLSHESPPIGVHSSKASDPHFRVRPIIVQREWAWLLFGARRLFLDGISSDFLSSYVIRDCRRSLSEPFPAMVDVLQVLWVPSCLGEGVFAAPSRGLIYAG